MCCYVLVVGVLFGYGVGVLVCCSLLCVVRCVPCVVCCSLLVVCCALSAVRCADCCV